MKFCIHLFAVLFSGNSHKIEEVIHQHFFPNPYQLALVYDPACFCWGVFYWQGEELHSDDSLQLFIESGTTEAELEEALREVVPQWIIGRVSPG